MTANNNKFGKRLKELRLARGLTQAAVAASSAISIKELSYYENGRRSPGLKNIIALCIALKCTMSELIEI